MKSIRQKSDESSEYHEKHDPEKSVLLLRWMIVFAQQTEIKTTTKIIEEFRENRCVLNAKKWGEKNNNQCIHYRDATVKNHWIHSWNWWLTMISYKSISFTSHLNFLRTHQGLCKASTSHRQPFFAFNWVRLKVPCPIRKNTPFFPPYSSVFAITDATAKILSLICFEIRWTSHYKDECFQTENEK